MITTVQLINTSSHIVARVCVISTPRNLLSVSNIQHRIPSYSRHTVQDIPSYSPHPV